jgi:hypothetical protein
MDVGTVTRQGLTAVLLLGVVLAGCRPPAPDTTPCGPRISVAPGCTVSVRARARRATGYDWALQGEGQLSISSVERAVSYTASERGGVALLTVTAHNAWGISPPTVLVVSPPATISLDKLVMMPRWTPCAGSDKVGIMEGRQPNCHTGSDCLRFTYPHGGGCGGFHWRPLCVASSAPTLSPIPSWPDHVAHIVPGGECSIDVLKRGNVRDVSRLTFWVRGDKGGEMVEFGIGGADVAPVPGRSTGEIELQSAWASHEINLEGLNLTSAQVLFYWLAADAQNPEGATFYLDDVRFEGVSQ